MAKADPPPNPISTLYTLQLNSSAEAEAEAEAEADLQSKRRIMIDIGSDCVAARVPTVHSTTVCTTIDCPLSALTPGCAGVCIKAEINWLYVGLPNALFTFVYACHRFDCRLSMPSRSLTLSVFCHPFLFSSTIVRVHFCTHFFLCTFFLFVWLDACRTF